MINIIRNRFRLLFIAIIAIVLSLASLSIFGLKAGIDFTAGSILTLNFEQTVEIDELKAELETLGYDNAVVQTTGEGHFLIRTEQLTNEEKNELQSDLSTSFGAVEEEGFENVDPVIARQTAQTAGIAVAVASLGILLYITWAFRRMPKPLHYGTCAVIALVHDAVISLGVFAILGKIMGWEINLMFIIGILAVIGYSVNNTVVVFDRIRENLLSTGRPVFASVVNNSLSETLIRSINTSLTTTIVVLALILFIGSTIQNFAVVMLTGIIAGTYSSLFVAPSILVLWENKEWNGLLKPFSKR